MADPIISRVYDIKISGYDDSIAKVKAMTAAWTKMDAAKGKLNKQLEKKMSSGDSAVIVELTTKIKQLENEMAALSSQRNVAIKESEAAANATNNEVSAYSLLIKSYKDAKLNAQEMAAQFGVDSEQAKEAAASAALYKSQLDAINASVKNGGVLSTKVPTEPVSTLTEAQKARPVDNLAELEAERLSLQQTGVVITELDKAEAEAAMTANEWASTQEKAVENIKASGTVVEAVSTDFQKYTGSLRENISLQIQNSQALAENKAAQKEIEQSIKDSGTATQAQLTKLVALKEEAIVLTESNKQLSVTIRNQAKEYISASGSIDELQAKVNQLQQAYEQLSDEERASPFGKAMKQEIDTLEPKVKELEGTIGKFQRNVGNYPAAFIAPFKTLAAEIDAVQGKLVSGNFTGAAQAKLIAQQEALAKANALVNKEFASSTAQANAFKQAATEVGLAYGQNSEFATKFTAQVKQSNGAVTEAGSAFNKATTASGGFVKSISGGYNILRKLAYLIPGLGIGSLVLLLLTPLQSVGAYIVKAVQDSMSGMTEITRQAQKQLEAFQAATQAVNEEYIKNSTATISKLELLRDVITDTTKTETERLSALNDYNKIADKNNQLDAKQLNNLNLINDSISRQIDLVGKRALATANEKILVDKAVALQLAEQKAAENAEKQLQTEDYYNKQYETAESAKTDAYFKNLQREGRKRQLIAQDQAVIDAQAAFDAQKKVNAEFLGKNGYVQDAIRERSDKLADEFNKKGLAALAKFNQDELTLLKNKYKEEAEDQNKSQDERNESLKKYYQVSKQLIDDNTKSQKDALALEVSQGINRANKLKDAKKQADALAAIEQYRVNKLKEINQDGNVQLQELNKQLFDEREKRFKEDMDREIANAKSVNKQIQDNSDLTPSTKAQAQVDEDNAIIRAQVAFFLKMDSLQKVFNLNSKTNWDDFRRGLSESNVNLNNDAKKAILSQLDDIDKTTDDAITKIKFKYDKLKDQVLSGKQSNTNKSNALNLLDQTQAVEVGGVQQNANVKKLIAAQQLYNFGLITKEQFEKIYAAAVKGQEDLNNAIEKTKDKITSVKGLLGEGISKLFGFKKGSDEAKEVSDIIQQSFDVAGQAMNSYFDNEEQRIQRSLKLNQQRLDIEQQQAEDQAQSQAERDSIDRQFAAKKDALNKEAFEKDKKLKKQQLTINYAIQLSNIAVAASANPLNAFTFGAAGIAQYIIQAAIATGAYLINLSNINKSQYATGGKVRMLGNGKITGAPNIPTQRNGDNVLATVKTGEVILNEEQQNKLGGAATFRAIGVPGFATGGIASLGGFNFSDKLQPPVNPSSFLNPSNNSKVNEEQMKRVYDAIDQQTENINQLARQTNERIDKIKVINVATETEKVNNNLKKASNIGRIN